MSNFKKIRVSIKLRQHQVLERIGKRETTHDKEYDKLKEQALQQFQVSRKLKKDFFQLEKHMQGTITGLNAIIRDFKFDQNPEEEEEVSYFDIVEQVMNEFDDFNARFDAKISKEKENFLDYYSAFSKLKQVIVERDEMKIKFDKFISHVKRLVSSFHEKPDPQKLSKARENLKQATKGYNEASIRAKTKFCEILEGIGTTFDPFLGNFLKSFEELFENLHGCFEKICDLTHSIDI